MRTIISDGNQRICILSRFRVSSGGSRGHCSRRWIRMTSCDSRGLTHYILRDSGCASSITNTLPSFFSSEKFSDSGTGISHQSRPFRTVLSVKKQLKWLCHFSLHVWILHRHKDVGREESRELKQTSDSDERLLTRRGVTKVSASINIQTPQDRSAAWMCVWEHFLNHHQLY